MKTLSEIVSFLRGRPPVRPVYRNRAARTGPQHVRAANSWRDNYNPLRSLTLATAVSYLELGQRGAYADLQWLYRTIERRDATLSALLARYEGALLEMDWSVRTAAELPRGASEAQAEAQAGALRDAYARIDNLRAALAHLVGARFRGFAHLEQWFGPAGEITHLEPVPQWYWVRDGINGPWQYNRAAASGIVNGEPIDPARFLVREVERPIDEIGLIAFLRKSLSQKDWDAYVETYGVPPLFIKGPPGASPDQEDEYQSVAEDIIADARGYLPHGADVATVDAGARGANPFRDHIRYQDELLVLAGTGGKLTMLAESGSGTLAGGAHEDSWQEIVAGEALLIAETLQSQLDAPLLAARFPGQPPLAYFELSPRAETDAAAVVDQIQKLAAAGLRVAPQQVRELTGYEVVPAPAATLGGSLAGGLANRAKAADPGGPGGSLDDVAPLIEAGRDSLARAVAEDLEPVRQRVADVLAIEDPAILARRLRALREELPGLLRDLNADPAGARALEDVLSAAVLSGMASRRDGPKMPQDAPQGAGG